MRSKFLYLAFAITATSFAQTKPVNTPQLDELTATKFKLYVTTQQVIKDKQLEIQLATEQNNKNMQELVIATEAKYPGYTFNFQTGALIPKPALSQIPKQIPSKVTPTAPKK